MPSSLLGKFTFALGILLAVYLQYVFWLGEGGMLRHAKLSHDIKTFELSNQTLLERNTQLAQEVTDLKTSIETVETRARLDLDYVKADEVFIKLSSIENTTPEQAPSRVTPIVDGDMAPIELAPPSLVDP